MNTTRIDKLLTETVDLREQSFTPKEETYFYKYIKPTNIYSLIYGPYSVNDIKIINTLLKYDNVYLKYNSNMIWTILYNIKFGYEHFDMLFDRYIALNNDKDYNIPSHFSSLFDYNVEYFISKWDMLKKLFLDERNIKRAVNIIFDLMKYAKNEQMSSLNTILNEILSAFVTDRKYLIKSICETKIIDNIIGDNVIDACLIDIPEWCVPDEREAYKSVQNLADFIRFLNVYNKFWDKKKAVKEITTKMKHIKITKRYYTILQVYERILNEVQFADTEVYDALKKRYNKAVAEV